MTRFLSEQLIGGLTEQMRYRKSFAAVCRALPVAIARGYFSLKLSKERYGENREREMRKFFSSP